MSASRELPQPRILGRISPEVFEVFRAFEDTCGDTNLGGKGIILADYDGKAPGLVKAVETLALESYGWLDLDRLDEIHLKVATGVARPGRVAITNVFHADDCNIPIPEIPERGALPVDLVKRKLGPIEKAFISQPFSRFVGETVLKVALEDGRRDVPFHGLLTSNVLPTGFISCKVDALEEWMVRQDAFSGLKSRTIDRLIEERRAVLWCGKPYQIMGIDETVLHRSRSNPFKLPVETTLVRAIQPLRESSEPVRREPVNRAASPKQHIPQS